jgi:hypothetical protein
VTEQQGQQSEGHAPTIAAHNAGGELASSAAMTDFLAPTGGLRFIQETILMLEAFCWWFVCLPAHSANLAKSAAWLLLTVA